MHPKGGPGGLRGPPNRRFEGGRRAQSLYTVLRQLPGPKKQSKILPKLTEKSTRESRIAEQVHNKVQHIFVVEANDKSVGEATNHCKNQLFCKKILLAYFVDT